MIKYELDTTWVATMAFARKKVEKDKDGNVRGEYWCIVESVREPGKKNPTLKHIKYCGKVKPTAEEIAEAMEYYNKTGMVITKRDAESGKLEGRTDDAPRDLSEGLAEMQPNSAERMAEYAMPGSTTKRETSGMESVYQAMEEQRPDLKARYKQNVRNTYDGLAKKYGPTFKDIFKNYYDYRIYQSILTSLKQKENPNRKPWEEGEYVIDEGRLEKNADDNATFVIQKWHFKIDSKIGELDNATCKQLDSTSFLITGERWGKSVEIKQDAIINRSKYGVPFYQYPARITYDGKAMSESEYARMLKNGGAILPPEPKKQIPHVTDEEFEKIKAEMGAWGYKYHFQDRRYNGRKVGFKWALRDKDYVVAKGNAPTMEEAKDALAHAYKEHSNPMDKCVGCGKDARQSDLEWCPECGDGVHQEELKLKITPDGEEEDETGQKYNWVCPDCSEKPAPVNVEPVGTTEKSQSEHEKVSPKDFDLKEYAGVWHEQGSTPQWFSKGCEESTAKYQIKGEKVEVTNTCKKDGEKVEAKGSAYPTEEPMKLEVGFFPASHPIFKADYKIAHLEKDASGEYSAAVVTSGDSTWILTRDKEISNEEYDRLISKAKSVGAKVSKIKRTRPESNNAQQRSAKSKL